MRLFKPGLLFVVSICGIVTTHAQDKIYFAANVNQGDVQDITSDIVKFIPGEKNSRSIYLETKKILLLFNNQGNFLLPSKMDFSREQSRRLIDSFLHPSSTQKNEWDKIYTKERQVVAGNIILEDNDFLYYSTKDRRERLEKRKVVAVIYRDGQHRIYGPATDAAEILWNAQQQSLKGTFGLEDQKTSQSR